MEQGREGMRPKRNMMNNQRRHQNNRYGRNNNNGGGGGGNHRNYNSGMENEDSDHVSPRQRKMAMTQREKYVNMGREAAQSGDRVLAEYYFQHADHYLRIINLSNPAPAQHHQHQNQSQQQEGGNHTSHQHQSQPQQPHQSHQDDAPQEDSMDDESASLPLDQVLPAPRSMPRTRSKPAPAPEPLEDEDDTNPY